MAHAMTDEALREAVVRRFVVTGRPVDPEDLEGVGEPRLFQRRDLPPVEGLEWTWEGYAPTLETLRLALAVAWGAEPVMDEDGSLIAELPARRSWFTPVQEPAAAPTAVQSLAGVHTLTTGAEPAPLPPVPARGPDGSLAWDPIVLGARAILSDHAGTPTSRARRVEAWLVSCGTTLEALTSELDRWLGRHP